MNISSRLALVRTALSHALVSECLERHRETLSVSHFLGDLARDNCLLEFISQILSGQQIKSPAMQGIEFPSLPRLVAL